MVLACGGTSAPSDGGITQDAGSSPVDAGSASASDAGPPLAGCGAADFVDRRGTAMVTIGFGGAEGSGVFDYSPRCVRVSVGQPIRFAGDFNTHPLSPGLTPGDAPPGNPVVRTPNGSTLDVVPTVAGAFPYLCDFHYAAGMRGVIRVE